METRTRQPNMKRDDRSWFGPAPVFGADSPIELRRHGESLTLQHLALLWSRHDSEHILLVSAAGEELSFGLARLIEQSLLTIASRWRCGWRSDATRAAQPLTSGADVATM